MQPPAIPPDENERLAALHSLGILDTPPEERFDRYTRLAKRLFRVPIALVTLIDEKRQFFKSGHGDRDPNLPREITFCGHTILGSEIMVVEDATQDTRFHDNPMVAADPNIRFYAGYPLPDPQGYRLGTLCILDQKPRVLEADDLEALRDIGAMVASELGSLQLATTDALTGLSNRRGFDALTKQALAQSRRGDEPCMLVAIDMDGFKAINDTLGHEVGDEALRSFAETLLETFRESDVVARTGGDEFTLLLTQTPEAEAHNAVKRLGVALAEKNSAPGAKYALRFSAGIAPVESDALTDAFRLADERMYADKKARKAHRSD